MSVMADTWIREQATQHGMIEPFVDRQQRKKGDDGVISWAFFLWI